MKTNIKQLFIGFILYLCLYSQIAIANALQQITISTFVNPANLSQIKNGEVILGGNITNIYYKYNGTVLGTGGIVTSNKNFALPYFQYAQRITDKIVFGFDITNPTTDDVSWPANGFQNVLGIDAIVQAREFIPKVSFSVTKNFAVGAGLRFYDIYHNEINYNLPPTGVLLNRSTGWTYGGEIGFWYMFNPTTFLDASYFSRMKARVTGESISGNMVNNNYFISPINFLPNTLVVNLTHIWSPKFLMALKVAYSWWNQDRNLILNNTATGPNPTVFPLNWSNSFFTSIFGRYELTPKAALLGALAYDESLVSPKNNLVGFPIGNVYIGTLGTQYQITKSTSLQFIAGQGRVNNPNIHTISGSAVGRSHARFTFADANLTIDF